VSIEYSDAGFAVRSEVSESHRRYWQRLARHGNWFTAEQRVAIAEAVRQAPHCALCDERQQALSPRAVDGEHSGHHLLAEPVIEAVHTIVRDAARITRHWYEDLLSRGMSDGEYVEIVGTVVSMVSIDSFADAIGVYDRQGDQLFYALEGDEKEWLPAYSTVRGVLPVNTIPSAKRWLYLVAPVRFEVDVTTPGAAAVRFNSTEGMRAWVNEREVALTEDRLSTDLENGRHTITLVIDRNAFPKPTLEAELIDVVDSPANVQLVGGL